MKKFYLCYRQGIHSVTDRLIRSKKVIVIILLLSLIFSNVVLIDSVQAETGTSVTVDVDYLQEIATVKAAAGLSTKFYMSTDNQKTWDLIDSSGVVDLSSLLAARAVTVYFKGNKDTKSVGVILQAEISTLTVAYKIANGVGKIEYTSALSVEYRKGMNGPWKLASPLMSTGIYELRGATLYFRTIATTGIRAGKIVTVKIAKRPTAPSVKVDGSKLLITGLKSGVTQYRVGDSTEWSTFPLAAGTSKSISLYSLLAPLATGNIAIPAATVEFRTVGTDKKLYSSVKLVDIALQATTPMAIAISGTSITVTDTDLKRYYEYTVVSSTSTLNLDTARWTSFTSKKPVVVKNGKAPVKVGDKVLVRLKSTTDTTSKQTILASTYKEFPVTSITPK